MTRRWLAILCVGILLIDFANQSTWGQQTRASDSALFESIEEFSDAWNQQGWNQPAGRRQYLRTMQDDCWKARMAVLQTAANGDPDNVKTLLTALNHEDVGTRVVAAQAIGYCTGEFPVETLIEKIKSDESAAVRLYVIDSLAMHGVINIADRLGDWQASNRDVKMHLAYAYGRDGAKIKPKIVDTLRDFDLEQLDSAAVGQPAPEFEMSELNGESIKLSDYLGKQSVVLVFIYGDT